MFLLSAGFEKGKMLRYSWHHTPRRFLLNKTFIEKFSSWRFCRSNSQPCCTL